MAEIGCTSRNNEEQNPYGTKWQMQKRDEELSLKDSTRQPEK